MECVMAWIWSILWHRILNAYSQLLVGLVKAVEPVGDRPWLSKAGHRRWAFDCWNWMPYSCCSRVPSTVMLWIASAPWAEIDHILPSRGWTEASWNCALSISLPLHVVALVVWLQQQKETNIMLKHWANSFLLYLPYVLLCTYLPLCSNCLQYSV